MQSKIHHQYSFNNLSLEKHLLLVTTLQKKKEKERINIHDIFFIFNENNFLNVNKKDVAWKPLISRMLEYIIYMGF